MANKRCFNGLLAIALLLLCLSHSVAAEEAAAFQFLEQCGGKGGNCNQVACADAPYLSQQCASGLACIRHNEWHFQCVPSYTTAQALITRDKLDQQAAPKNASKIGILAVFGQCGGRGGDCGVKKVCVDSIYPEDKCPVGTACIRHSEWYWQCVPLPAGAASGSNSSSSVDAAGAPAVGIASLTTTVTAVTAGPSKPVMLSTGSAAGNIKGSTLVLDVGSLTRQSNSQLPIINAEQCSLYCRNTKGCSGWSFCNSAAGCGAGCKHYVSNNPAFTQASFYHSLSNPLMYLSASIQNFGPFGKTAGCAAAADGDKWPLGMCSLKIVSDPSHPEFFSDEEAAGNGWVSGWFTAPAECAGLSPKTCQRCLASQHTAACFKCAQLASQKTSLLESVISGPNIVTAADGCL